MIKQSFNKWTLLVIISTVRTSAICQPLNQLELTGFFLGQYRKAVHAQLGAPIKRINTEDKWIYEFHNLNADTSAYALFKYAAKDTFRIHSIQINGHYLEGMHDFLGLVLGDSRDKVDKLFGTPSEIKVIDNPRVDVLYYANRNYSVEIDENGKLYGIQIFGGFKERPKSPTPKIEGFRNAVVSGDVDSLIFFMCPDVELYKEDRVISFIGSMRDEFKRKDSDLIKLLLGKSNSVHEVFEKERIEPTVEMRLYTEKGGMSMVYKFHESKIIAEIVFMPYGGEWKVYEVRFR